MVNLKKHLDLLGMRVEDRVTGFKGVVRENAKLADEYEFAAEALRKLHNEGFNEGVLAGLKDLAESCKARREKQTPNAK